jgi:hypothetical protein
MHNQPYKIELGGTVLKTVTGLFRLLRTFKESTGFSKKKPMASSLMILLLLSFFAFTLETQTANARTYYNTFYAYADSYIEDGNTGRNNGWDRELLVYYPRGFEFYIHGYSLLKFDLSSIPRDAVIISAQLKMYLEAGSGKIEVRRITSDWQEGTVTWDHQPSMYTPPSSPPYYVPTYSDVGPTSKRYQWTVTDIVKGWFDGSFSNYGLLLKPLYETSPNTCSCVFYSREYRGDNYIGRIPALEVAYETVTTPPTPPPTPEPEPIDNSPPAVTITSTPDIDVFNTPRILRVRANATDNVGLRSLELTGPGRSPVPWSTSDRGVLTHELSYDFMLDYGVNVFTAYAYDRVGQSTTVTKTIRVEHTPPLLQISNLKPITQHGPDLVANRQTMFKFNYTLDYPVPLTVRVHLKLEENYWETTIPIFRTERIEGVDYIILPSYVTLYPTPDGKQRTAYLFEEMIGRQGQFLPKPLYKGPTLKVYVEIDPFGGLSWDSGSNRSINGQYETRYSAYGSEHSQRAYYSSTIKIIFLEPNVHDRAIFGFTDAEKVELSENLIGEPYRTGEPYPYERYLDGLFPANFLVNREATYWRRGYVINWWDADALGEEAADEGYGRVVAIVPNGAIAANEGGNYVGVVFHRFYGLYDQSYHVAFVEYDEALDPGRYTYFPIVAHELSHTYRYPDIYDGYQIVVPYEDCAFFDEVEGGIIKVFNQTLLTSGNVRVAESYLLDPIPGEDWSSPLDTYPSSDYASAWDIMDHSGQERAEYWSYASYENAYYYTHGGDDPPETLLVSMIVYKNGTVVGRPFQKLYNQTVSFPGTDATGNFSLILYNRDGGVFRNYPFNGSFYCSVEPGGLKETEAVPFLTVVEWNDNLGRIELKDSEGKVWFSREVSAHTPTVSITSPEAGKVLGINNNYNISWEGNDEDGDPLWYTVLVQKEGDQVWRSLASRIQNQSITFSPSDEYREGNYSLQIKVTDGVNTAVKITQFSVAAGQLRTCTISADSNAHVTITGAGTYEEGETAQITAPTEASMEGIWGLLGAKYRFSRWEGDIKSTENGLTINITGDEGALSFSAFYISDYNEAYLKIGLVTAIAAVIVIGAALVRRRSRKN